MYLVLSAYFFALGAFALFSLRKSVIFFAFSLAILPTSLAFGPKFSSNGLFFFDFYFFPLAINLFISQKKMIDLPKNIPIWLLVGSVFFLFASATINIMANWGHIDEVFLSDTRIILVFVETLLLCSAVRQMSPLSNQTLIYLALLAAISCLVLWVMNYAGMLQFQDVYYEEFNRTRYKQVGTEICLLYIIFYFADLRRYHIQRTRLTLIVLALCVLAVLASGSRVIIVAIVIASLLASSSIISRTASIAVGAVAVIAFLYAQFFFGFLHVTDNLTISGLAGQLADRFSPAMPYLADTNVFSFLFGHGFGTSFYIPWFEYRDIRTEQSVLDSAHLSMFIKFGIMYLVIIAVLLKALIADLPDKLKRAIVVYFLFIGFVIAFPYRPGFIGSVTWCCLFGNMLRAAHPTPMERLGRLRRKGPAQTGQRPTGALA